MPNITHTEIAVVCAAVLLLYAGPVVLAWGDARRRRRALRQAAAVSGEGTAAIMLGAIPVDSQLQGVNQFAGAAELNPMVPSEPSAAAVAESDSVVPAVAEPLATGLELRPLEGSAEHRLRLADLHHVRLPDWPPAVIHDDPERSRWWREAEEAVEQHRQAIDTAIIWSPYPARSSCLGAAEADGPKLRLCVLLFPVLWPVSQNQAVAQAVFEIDRERNEIRGWVDALRAAELTEENRREIREIGGEA